MHLGNVLLSEGEALITFTSFKHHTGPPITVVISTTANADCPVTDLAKFLSLRDNTPGPQFVFPGGTPKYFFRQ